METSEQIQMVTCIIDGQTISVPKGTTVFHAAQQLGIELPIFCYHDRMPPFGACRVCLVEVEKMPKLQTSCTLEVTEGMVVKTRSEIAVKGREGILEFLLINHPLDCPICDRGGECPLQDLTLKYGPGESRFYEDKRRFKKPLPLGPVLMLDRERCIVCARCTRFSDIVVGDHALEFLDRGYKTEVGTPNGEPVESKFIGNTIQICPVGALTSQVYRFRARPWDNDPTPSTCTLCPVGCSMILDSRDEEIVRIRSRENREVNDIWLCDKGWFGYEFTYNPNRLQTPLIRRSGKLEPAGWEEALSLVANKIKEAQPSRQIAGWGGNPLTVEDNYLFQKLIREKFGINHLDHRIGQPIFSLEEEGWAPGMEISIGECEKLSVIILLGVDLTEEFPIIWLRLKQALNRGAKLIFFGHFAPEIAPYCFKTILHAPGQEIEILQKHFSEIEALIHEDNRVALFIGNQYLHQFHRLAILAELSRWQVNFPQLTINLLEANGNSIGARLAGMRPDLGPFEKPLSDPGLNAWQVLEQAVQKGWQFLYIAGANPALKFPSRLWKEAKAKIGCLVVQDLFLTETAQQADIFLPTLSFVEKGGHFVNIEKRVSKLQPGKQIPKNMYSDTEIFTWLADILDISLPLDENFLSTLQHQHLKREKRKKIEEIKREEFFKDQGLKVTFAHALFDCGVRMKHDPHLIRLAKEPTIRLNPLEGQKRGIQNEDYIRLSTPENRIIARVTLDKQVAMGTVVLPVGFEKIPVQDLNHHWMNGWMVDIQKEV